jgi:hypothetical protein
MIGKVKIWSSGMAITGANSATPGVYCVSCWNIRECGATLETPFSDWRRAQWFAHDAGWRLGLDATGQAHHSCPACLPALSNPFPIPNAERPADYPKDRIPKENPNDGT